jgi:hypothetical protein
MCPMQIKRKIKSDAKKNGHVIFLKYYPKVHLLLSLPTIQIKVYMSLPLGEKVFEPTSNGPRRIRNTNCCFITSIKNGKNPTGT